MKRVALILALVASPALAQDGYWYANNLVAACDATNKMASGEVEVTEGDAVVAEAIGVTCGAYLRGFAEGMAVGGRQQLGGTCIDATNASVEVLAQQLPKTASANPALVADGELSGALLLVAMADAYPCR